MSMSQKVPHPPISYMIIIHLLFSMTVVEDGYLELMPLFIYMCVYVYTCVYVCIYVYIYIQTHIRSCLEDQEIKAEIAQEYIYTLVKQDAHLYIICVREIFTFVLEKGSPKPEIRF